MHPADAFRLIAGRDQDKPGPALQAQVELHAARENPGQAEIDQAQINVKQPEVELLAADE